MTRLTRDQVVGLAPDDSSVKAAQKLATPGPWSEAGTNGALLWGKCKGSGKNPYQVSIDLSGPAFKCSCPSRKFPCKHALALMLLWSQGPDTIADVDQPADFAADWASDRAERAVKKAERAASPKPVDAKAQARRLDQRLELMSSGIAELELWLSDLYANGLAGTRKSSYSYWDDFAARLVDAQLPGLAQRVREIPSVLSREDWADVMMNETALLYTATQAWQRRDRLGDDQMANLRSFLGWSIPTDEVRTRGETVSGQFLVAGVVREERGRMEVQRTWLAHLQSGAIYLVVDFAVGSEVLPVIYLTGQTMMTTIALYPGSGVRRALMMTEPVIASSATAEPVEVVAVDIAEAFRAMAGFQAANPFVDQVPAFVNAHPVLLTDHTVVLADSLGGGLTLREGLDPWELLASGAPCPVPLFIELDEGRARPLAQRVDGEWVKL